MRWVGLCFLLNLTSAVAAPLGVQIRFEKDAYLVYEEIPLHVTIHNYSGRTVQLGGDDQEPWLDLVVTGESGAMIRALARPTFGPPVLIPPGETVSQTINLLPLFELRERGTYRVRAIVRNASGSYESGVAQFALINGRELWSQMVGLPVHEGGTEEYRTFALIAHRGPREDALYVSVKDDVHGVVYSLVPLGGFLSTQPPEVRLDNNGNLHVLFQNSPRSFGYVMVDSSARPSGRAAYSDFTSRPKLTVNTGEVSVTGGEQTYPKVERILTDGELNPPPPPPTKPKPKHRWYWPFGPRS
jgi:hypothetical protein